MNCTLEINERDSFCKEWGVKIIKERITTKSLFSNFLTSLGWDSNFFITLRYLLFQPQVVFKEYINGTRKKYTNPFSFFAIMTAVSLFIFSQYSEQLIELSTNINLQPMELIESTINETKIKKKDIEMFGYKNEKEFKKGMMEFQMKYYNLFAFLLLPIYTLIAFIVFRKPYNYGEYLIINTYIQDTTTLLGALLFIFSIIIGFNLFGTGIMIVPFFYYCFAYKKLNKLTFGQILLKALKFIGIFLLIMVMIVLIGFFSTAIKN